MLSGNHLTSEHHAVHEVMQGAIDRTSFDRVDGGESFSQHGKSTFGVVSRPDDSEVVDRSPHRRSAPQNQCRGHSRRGASESSSAAQNRGLHPVSLSLVATSSDETKLGPLCDGERVDAMSLSSAQSSPGLVRGSNKDHGSNGLSHNPRNQSTEETNLPQRVGHGPGYELPFANDGFNLRLSQTTLYDEQLAFPSETTSNHRSAALSTTTNQYIVVPQVNVGSSDQSIDPSWIYRSSAAIEDTTPRHAVWPMEVIEEHSQFRVPNELHNVKQSSDSDHYDGSYHEVAGSGLGPPVGSYTAYLNDPTLDAHMQSQHGSFRGPVFKSQSPNTLPEFHGT